MLLVIPFWPLTLISSPSGPCTIVTPGVSCMKLRKLRPLFGKPRSACWLISVDASDARRLDDGRIARDRDLLRDTADLQDDRDIRRLADHELDAVLLVVGEASECDGQSVGAERQQQATEAAVGIGHEVASEVRPGILQGDRRAWQHGAG